ncbi:MAG: acylphosphatase [Candidatus Peribacteraceae bacterium]|nr:acylphosphatase [Candidatus Peribacteraceae bacterium]
MTALRIKITGLVQGVFFRAHAKEQADTRGLRGWVRNSKDGTVEIHAEGTEESLKELEAWCHRGPPEARVENVQSQNALEEQHRSFEILR